MTQNPGLYEMGTCKNPKIACLALWEGCHDKKMIENRDVKCFSYLSSGYYCEDGLNELPCPAGTYGNRTGAASADEGCAACPHGKDKSTEVLMYQ